MILWREKWRRVIFNKVVKTRLCRRVPAKFPTKTLEKIFSFLSSAGENFPTAFKHVFSLSLHSNSWKTPRLCSREVGADFCYEFFAPPPNKCFQELFILPFFFFFLLSHLYERKKKKPSGSWRRTMAPQLVAALLYPLESCTQQTGVTEDLEGM